MSRAWTLLKDAVGIAGLLAFAIYAADKLDRQNAARLALVPVLTEPAATGSIAPKLPVQGP